jgi:YD repeat-containing protein
VDPEFNSSNAAVCTSTVYDVLGRAIQTYVPFLGGTSIPTTVVPVTGGGQYVQSAYDALGRVTSTQLMVSGHGQLPPTFTAYGASGSRWTTLVTDANRCRVQTLTDILGHTVEHDVQNSALNASGQCPSTVTWLPTTMTYDVAGHLLQVTDPLLNQTTFQYDGLGRKTQMTDPDMGNWSYQYDNNGNLTVQTDGRKATTYLHYDPLNRISIKDLPYYALSTSTWTPGTPGEEDEVTYYDQASNLTTCYSCDDHCAVTIDTCDTNTLVCTHSGPAVCPASCTGDTACTPGVTESCGNCGTHTCGSDCAWGACTGQGVCAAGDTMGVRQLRHPNVYRNLLVGELYLPRRMQPRCDASVRLQQHGRRDVPIQLLVE